MSWKLDDIDFKDYGVGVIKSSGVLDMPRIVDASTDWLDSNGRDYWQEPEDVKYQAREIQLNCWIRATSFDEFKTKVAAFYAALVAPGERTLTTVFGTEIAHVTIQQSIQMVRKTQYVSSLQIGMFTLRLTVAGDDTRKYMTVFNSGWEFPISAPYSGDAKLTRSLQNVSEISFTSEVNTTQPHGTGNYIIYKDERYIAFDYPQVDKVAWNKYVYRLVYKHQIYFLNDVQFRVLDRSDTPWQSTVEDIVDMIITNANRVHPGLFRKGTVITTDSRNNTFSNETCYDILNRITTEYELEWEFKSFPADNYIEINVKKVVDFDTELVFEYGKDNELYKISRTLNPRENLCTRLYAYGSEKNIPATYGYPRLKLPVEPIEYEFWGMVIERTKIWDDIYPMRTGTVKAM